MKNFQDLQEGLQDPNIFKAFFLAGGPGSGKSYVVRKTTGGTGLRVVNSDDAFEALLKKANLSLKMPEEEEAPTLSEEVFSIDTIIKDEQLLAVPPVATMGFWCEENADDSDEAACR